MKNYNDTIGNRTRDFPTCSAVPQPTALPRSPYRKVVTYFIRVIISVLNCNVQFLSYFIPKFGLREISVMAMFVSLVPKRRHISNKLY